MLVFKELHSMIADMIEEVAAPIRDELLDCYGDFDTEKEHTIDQAVSLIERYDSLVTLLELPKRAKFKASGCSTPSPDLIIKSPLSKIKLLSKVSIERKTLLSSYLEPIINSDGSLTYGVASYIPENIPKELLIPTPDGPKPLEEDEASILG